MRGLIVAGAGRAGEGFSPDLGGPVELLPVANRAIVEHALVAVAAAGAADAIVAGPATLLEQLEAALSKADPVGLPVAYAEQSSPGVGAALVAAADRLRGASVLVHRGDGLAGPGLEAAARPVADGEADAVVLVTPARAEASPSLESRRLLRLAGHGMPGAVAGAWVIGEETVQAAATRFAPDRPLELSEVLGCIADGRVTSAGVEGWHRYAGRAEDLLELNRIVLEGLRLQSAAAMPACPGSRIHGRVAIHPTALVEASVIRGPAVIGAGARIRDAFIGPYTAIGDRVHIEGAELERSIILPGARILHIERRLEGSVIGRDARVFRDFSLPRALRLHVGDRVEVCLC